MLAGEVGAELRSKHARQWLFQRLVDADLAAFVNRRGGDLATDKAGADDVDGAATIENPAEGDCVRQLAQVERSLERRQLTR